MTLPPFIAPKHKKIEALVLKDWWEHPTQLRCICGITMYARVHKDAEMVVTKMECGDDRCGKLIHFVHLFDRHSINACDIISLSNSLSSGR